MSKLAYYMTLAANGTAGDVDLIMKDLTDAITFADSRFIDYALSLVKSDAGMGKISEYLFKGTQIQRNYSAHCFSTDAAKRAIGRWLKRPTLWD